MERLTVKGETNYETQNHIINRARFEPCFNFTDGFRLDRQRTADAKSGFRFGHRYQQIILRGNQIDR